MLLPYLQQPASSPDKYQQPHSGWSLQLQDRGRRVGEEAEAEVEEEEEDRAPAWTDVGPATEQSAADLKSWEPSEEAPAFLDAVQFRLPPLLKAKLDKTIWFANKTVETAIPAVCR